MLLGHCGLECTSGSNGWPWFSFRATAVSLVSSTDHSGTWFLLHSSVHTAWDCLQTNNLSGFTDKEKRIHFLHVTTNENLNWHKNVMVTSPRQESAESKWNAAKCNQQLTGAKRQPSSSFLPQTSYSRCCLLGYKSCSFWKWLLNASAIYGREEPLHPQVRSCLWIPPGYFVH